MLFMIQILLIFCKMFDVFSHVYPDIKKKCILITNASFHENSIMYATSKKYDSFALPEIISGFRKEFQLSCICFRPNLGLATFFDKVFTIILKSFD